MTETIETTEPISAPKSIPLDYFAIGIIFFLIGYALAYKSMSAVMPKQIIRNTI